MTRIAIGSLALIATALLGLARAQSTRPTDGERLAQTAKEFGMTPEQLDRWVRKELGDPVVVDGDLVVGVRRDGAGRVSTVKVSTRKHSIEFNRDADEKHPGMRYIGTDVAAEGHFGSVTDLDGDGRVDQIILRAGENPEGAILIRLGDRFERAAEALGDGRYKLAADGRTVSFDRNARQWIEQH